MPEQHSQMCSAGPGPVSPQQRPLAGSHHSELTTEWTWQRWRSPVARKIADRKLLHTSLLPARTHPFLSSLDLWALSSRAYFSPLLIRLPSFARSRAQANPFHLLVSSTRFTMYTRRRITSSFFAFVSATHAISRSAFFLVTTISSC